MQEWRWSRVMGSEKGFWMKHVSCCLVGLPNIYVSILFEPNLTKNYATFIIKTLTYWIVYYMAY
jgi:hypothetical protein